MIFTKQNLAIVGNKPLWNRSERCDIGRCWSQTRTKSY